jgi:hypothetical protein
MCSHLIKRMEKIDLLNWIFKLKFFIFRIIKTESLILVFTDYTLFKYDQKITNAEKRE